MPSPVLHYRVIGPRFYGAVAIADGKVQKTETALYLRRLAGLTEEALRRYAAARGWQIERQS